MTYDEKIKCLEYLKNVSEKEYTEGEKQKIKDFYQKLFAKISKDLDFEKKQHTSIHGNIGIQDSEEEDN